MSLTACFRSFSACCLRLRSFSSWLAMAFSAPFALPAPAPFAWSSCLSSASAISCWSCSSFFALFSSFLLNESKSTFLRLTAGPVVFDSFSSCALMRSASSLAALACSSSALAPSSTTTGSSTLGCAAAGAGAGGSAFGAATARFTSTPCDQCLMTAIRKAARVLLDSWRKCERRVCTIPDDLRMPMLMGRRARRRMTGPTMAMPWSPRRAPASEMSKSFSHIMASWFSDTWARLALLSSRSCCTNTFFPSRVAVTSIKWSTSFTPASPARDLYTSFTSA
mmetsp:Transcript_25055/g.70153  ORF Transcript_25055/g.70153 Transcript_25055/m.70153 type:complete len:280 (-) Transcript_25055:83-922(-)